MVKGMTCEVWHLDGADNFHLSLSLSGNEFLYFQCGIAVIATFLLLQLSSSSCSTVVVSFAFTTIFQALDKFVIPCLMFSGALAHDR